MRGCGVPVGDPALCNNYPIFDVIDFINIISGDPKPADFTPRIGLFAKWIFLIFIIIHMNLWNQRQTRFFDGIKQSKGRAE